MFINNQQRSAVVIGKNMNRPQSAYLRRETTWKHQRKDFMSFRPKTAVSARWKTRSLPVMASNKYARTRNLDFYFGYEGDWKNESRFRESRNRSNLYGGAQPTRPIYMPLINNSLEYDSWCLRPKTSPKTPRSPKTKRYKPETPRSPKVEMFKFSQLHAKRKRPRKLESIKRNEGSLGQRKKFRLVKKSCRKTQIIEDKTPFKRVISRLSNLDDLMSGINDSPIMTHRSHESLAPIPMDSMDLDKKKSEDVPLLKQLLTYRFGTQNNEFKGGYSPKDQRNDMLLYHGYVQSTVDRRRRFSLIEKISRMLPYRMDCSKHDIYLQANLIGRKRKMNLINLRKRPQAVVVSREFKDFQDRLKVIRWKSDNHKKRF